MVATADPFRFRDPRSWEERQRDQMKARRRERRRARRARKGN